MRAIDKWRRLAPTRRRALLPALATVAAVRVLLRLVPLPTWQRLAARVSSGRQSGESANAALQDVTWAVRVVSRAVPGATCLTQALAAQLLLARRGCPSRLKIGVARTPDARLRAHAWLESDGLVVLGGSGVEEYTPLAGATYARGVSIGGRNHHLQ